MSKALPLIAYPDLEAQVKAIENDGYVYFPGVLNAEEVAELRAAMDRLDAIPASFDRHGTPENGGFLNKHINNAFNRDVVFLQYLDKPGITELEEAVHGDDCHVIGMTAWTTGPGRPDQTLHTDWLPIRLPKDVLADPRVKVPIFITTAHYYLDDLYEELGPTKFVPGSHESGRSPEGATEWKGAGEQSILCNAGDVVIFRSEVWHRGSANRSNQNRYLLQVHYANRMITQKFPPYLNKFQFDEAILSQATPRQRRLLGEHRPGAYD
ncbi:MAG: phytanoyl-CoA dioxygenase family protein [Candidatus Poribacteria bacterium]|nr:phytanoyl-CoA dioxygenase family protein [Candidatus Poribacteria bacterium]